VVRVDTERLFERCPSLRVAPELPKDHADVVASLGVIRVQREELFERCERAFGIVTAIVLYASENTSLSRRYRQKETSRAAAVLGTLRRGDSGVERRVDVLHGEREHA